MSKKELLFETACDKLLQADIRFKVACGRIMHIKSGKLNFYAGTGTITQDGVNDKFKKGIDSFIELILNSRRHKNIVKRNSKKKKPKKWGTRMPNGRIRLLVRK